MAAGGGGGVIWMRPERAAAGRPAGHSRDEITAAAVAIADREGLDAVSMRRVAADLGTGAASLYRYLHTREDLLDLMIDATGAEYALTAPTGDWLADLLDIGEQARAIMRHHPWLPPLLITRPVLGPNGLVLLEHVLETLASHPASTAAKVEAFALLTAATALFVQNELAGGPDRQRRNAAYLQHALAAGRRPRLAELLTAPPPPPGTSPAQAATGPADRYRDILARILSGLLGPATDELAGRAASIPGQSLQAGGRDHDQVRRRHDRRRTTARRRRRHLAAPARRDRRAAPATANGQDARLHPGG